jgi:hypothetical protein
MREMTTGFTRSFLASLWDAPSHDATRGFEDSTPWLRSLTPPASVDHCQIAKLEAPGWSLALPGALLLVSVHIKYAQNSQVIIGCPAVELVKDGLQ